MVCLPYFLKVKNVLKTKDLNFLLLWSFVHTVSLESIEFSPYDSGGAKALQNPLKYRKHNCSCTREILELD